MTVVTVHGIKDAALLVKVVYTEVVFCGIVSVEIIVKDFCTLERVSLEFTELSEEVFVVSISESVLIVLVTLSINFIVEELLLCV